MKNKINIMEWNIHGATGYGNYSTPVFVADWIMENKIDIAILTEFVTGCGWEYLQGRLEKQFALFVSPYISKNNQCLIALKKNIGFSVEQAQVITEMCTINKDRPDFLQLNVKYKGTNINVIGTRIRDYSNSNEWLSLDEHISSLTNEVVICLGDFNAYWSNQSGKIWRTDKNTTLPNTCKEYDIETPDWSLLNNSFSYVLPGGKKINIDSLIYRGVSLINEFKYEWNFVSKENGYGKVKPFDEKSHLIGLPDHAILRGTVAF